MFMIYNPYSGEWERLDDLNRAMPCIERNCRPLFTNNTVSFIPTQSTSHAPNQTDLFTGSTNEARANVSMPFDGVDADVVWLDAWRIRRFLLVFNRGSSGSTSITISAAVWGRLRRPDGTFTNWRRLVDANDSAATTDYPVRLVLAAPTSSVFGFDQYRITVRRDQTSEPAPAITQVRIFFDY